jgi:hypothetical protein
MKIKIMLPTLAALFAAAVACFGADVNVGTWKINAAKSKNLPADEKNQTLVIAVAGESLKFTIDGVDAKGKPYHDEWTGKLDGKDYPVTGDPDADTRAYKPINSHTLELIEKKGGKIISTARVAYSADGKTRTVTGTQTNADGTKTTGAEVYDKQ